MKAIIAKVSTFVKGSQSFVAGKELKDSDTLASSGFVHGVVIDVVETSTALPLCPFPRVAVCPFELNVCGLKVASN